MTEPRVAAVILAAGRGTRFGPEPKQLASYGGRPLVVRAAQAALASRARPVVVVLGAHAEAVRAALARARFAEVDAGSAQKRATRQRLRAEHDGNVIGHGSSLDLRLVVNPDFASGLSTSLRAGLAALPADAEAMLAVLGDMPRIEAAHLDRLIAAYASRSPRPAAVVPVHAGRRGNPVLLDHRRLAEDLAGLRGDHGAGPLLRGRGDVLEIAEDAAVGFDVDAPDALLPHPRG